MIGRTRELPKFRATLCALATITLLPGCWWQRDAYTSRMVQEMQVFELRAKYDQVLGEPFQAAGDCPIWIRPPKITTLRALPAELEGTALALFQGSNPGAALIEVVIVGSSGAETVTEFVQTASAALNKAGKGPGKDLDKRDPVSVRCMHGGETSFDLFSGGAARQLAGSPTPTNYQWVYYVTEEGTQKVFVAFIIPDANYEAFSDSMVKCLESLAMGSKVSIAAASR